MAVLLCMHMKRTTVMLPAELKARAERRAYERGVSVGELVRESLENALEMGEERRIEDPLFKDQAVYKGKTPKDLAERHDKYLYDDRPSSG
jgi:plasmid stability protein